MLVLLYCYFHWILQNLFDIKSTSIWWINKGANLFQLFPNPLLTVDQLKLLKYDNILSKKYQTNSDIGVPSKRIFDQEVEKYCYMWREGGKFSTKKYNSIES